MPETLVNFLKYVEDSSDTYVRTTNDPVVHHLHDRIKDLKASREMEGRYMRLDELLRDTKNESLEEGIEQGQNRLLQLIELMSESGEADQIARLGREPEFLESMFAKYHL